MSSHARFRLLLDSLNGHRELQSLGEHLLDENEALKAQRDELLKSLKRVMGLHDVEAEQTFCLDGRCGECVECSARAAIAKAEGER